MTHIDGKFSLPSAKQGETIVVTYLGMDSQTVKAAPGMKVNMQSQDRQLDEVIVVARWQKKSSFTGSAGVAKGDLLEKKQLTNVFSGLQGEVAGVQMTNTSGSANSHSFFCHPWLQFHQRRNISAHYRGWCSRRWRMEQPQP